MRVVVDDMDWIPQPVRRRLAQQQASRINRAGELVIAAQEFRTQTQNRQAAVQKLKTMILQAWPEPKVRKMRKGLSKKTKEQRKEDKRRRSQVKQNRKRVSDW